MKHKKIYRYNFILLILLISSCASNSINTNSSYVEKKVKFNDENFWVFDNKTKSVIFVAEPRVKGIYKKTLTAVSIRNYDNTLSISSYEQALFEYFFTEKRYDCYIRKSNYINKSKSGMRGYQFFYTCP